MHLWRFGASTTTREQNATPMPVKFVTSMLRAWYWGSAWLGCFVFCRSLLFVELGVQVLTCRVAPRFGEVSSVPTSAATQNRFHNMQNKVPSFPAKGKRSHTEPTWENGSKHNGGRAKNPRRHTRRYAPQGDDTA